MMLDPHHEGSVDFPYDEIEERIDGPQAAPPLAGQLIDEINRRADARAAALFRQYVRWLAHGSALKVERPYQNRKFSRQIARRAIASSWVLDPSLYDGQSLLALSKATGIGSKKTQLSKYADEFSLHFGVVSRGQHAKTRAKATKRLHHCSQPTDPSRN